MKYNISLGYFMKEKKIRVLNMGYSAPPPISICKQKREGGGRPEEAGKRE
jgi:hypothetical protein